MRLCADEIACRRGGRLVLDRLSFALGNGEALLVTGPNGVGKSTLLRAVAGLLRLATGQIRIEDGDAEKTLAEQSHYLAHQDALKPSLTVAENLDFWTAYLGGSGAAEEALAAVGLETLSTLPAAYLSAGQRRRLSLARLLTAPRPIWLLDEPTAALDTAGSARLTSMMKQHLGGGGIIVAATHGPIGLSRARELTLGQA